MKLNNLELSYAHFRNDSICNWRGKWAGEATCNRLAANGARVAVVDTNIDRATEVASKIDGFAVQADVADSSSVEEAFDAVENNFGVTARIIVNCAGIGRAARIVGRERKLSIDTFEQVLRINLFGTYNVMSHGAARAMELDPLEGGERGIVVNTSSVAWQDGQLGQAAYAASKGAISSLCLPAAREFSRAGIRVMTIAPGLF